MFGFRGVVSKIGLEGIFDIFKIEVLIFSIPFNSFQDELSALWNNMCKNPWDLESLLADRVLEPRGGRYLRLGIDRIGVDPTKVEFLGCYPLK